MKLVSIGSALLVGLSAIGGGALWADPNSTPPSVARAATQDRISDGQLREMVKQPLAEMLAGELARGEKDFEGLLAERARSAGPHSVEVADTLTAMGVSLYLGALDVDNEDLERKSLSYLRRAIAATQAAFGPNDPEVALALNSYATAKTNLDPSDPGPDTEADLQEAYRIRLATLGPLNAETETALAGLAKVKGLRTRTGGDPSKIAAAAGLLDAAISVAERNAEEHPVELTLAYMDAARFWARYDDVNLAKEYFEKVKLQHAPLAGDGLTASDAMAIAALDFASALKEGGHTDEAEAIRKDYAVEIASMISRAKHSP